MGFWGDESCYKNVNVVGCVFICELIVFILFNYILYRWWNRFEGFVILFLNNVLNFVLKNMYVVILNWYLIYYDYDGKLCYGFYGLRKVVEIY